MKKNYLEDKRLNQSFLKKFLNPNPRSLYRCKDQDLYFEREKIHFTKGKLVDIFLTGTDADFQNNYIVSDVEYKASVAVDSIIQELLDNDLDYSKIIDIARKQGYRNNYTDEKLIEYFDKYKEYYNFRKESKNKTVISVEDLELAEQMSTALLQGEYTSKYFKNAKFQVDLYTNECKGLIDILQLTDDTVRVVDIKTTGDYLEKFSFDKFNYDVQLLFYEQIVTYNYPKHELLPSTILAVSKKEPEYAEPFQMTEETRNNGLEKLNTIWENYNYWIQHHNYYNRELKENGVNYV